jgi:hypothetical protein
VLHAEGSEDGLRTEERSGVHEREAAAARSRSGPQPALSRNVVRASCAGRSRNCAAACRSRTLIAVRVVHGALVVATISAMGGACSLLTSVEGLSGGDALAADAADTGETSRAEASIPLGDGGDAGPWCATHKGDASFCEDFDTNALGVWETIFEAAGGTTHPDPAAATSLPFALLSELPAADAGKTEGYVAHRLALPAGDIALEIDLRVDKASTTTGQVQLAKLLQLGANDDALWELGLAVNDRRTLVFFQYNYSNNGYTRCSRTPLRSPSARGRA